MYTVPGYLGASTASMQKCEQSEQRASRQRARARVYQRAIGLASGTISRCITFVVDSMGGHHTFRLWYPVCRHCCLYSEQNSIRPLLSLDRREEQMPADDERVGMRSLLRDVREQIASSQRASRSSIASSCSLHLYHILRDGSSKLTGTTRTPVSSE